MESKDLNPTLRMLLATTEELILEKGCQRTTLQDILQKSGVSKGAIYHYVKSKDELFALILQQRQESANVDFSKDVLSNRGALAPFQGIANHLSMIADSDQVSNLIFIYLLSKMDKEQIHNILQDLHKSAVQMGNSWIEVGKKHQVIPEQIDGEKLSEIFNVFRYGLVVQNIIAANSKLKAEDIYQLLVQNLTTSR